MKRILKNDEPAAFSAWKTQEAENLEGYYLKNIGTVFNENQAYEKLV